MRYYTLQQLAEKIDIGYASIVNYAARDYFKDLFETRKIPRSGNNGVVNFMRYYPIKVIAEDNIEEFMKRKKEYKERNKRVETKGFYWTRTSIECYENNFDCEHCSNFDICKCSLDVFGIPTLRKISMEILKKYGKPLKSSYEFCIESE